MKQRLGIIGTGYVGLVTGACFADLGYEVVCLDIVPEKVDKINRGIPPIFENGLEELLKRVVDQKLLRATLDRQDMLDNSDIIFLCLATPSADNGAIDLSIFINEMENLGRSLQNTEGYKTFIVKSTVVPGSTSGIIRETLEKHSNMRAGGDFGLAMNPEFLMEGLAISNFSNPDRVVIGAIDSKSFDLVAGLYKTFDCEVMQTSTSAAEMIKYGTNSFLALKVSFINEIANMCELLGIDVGDVAKGIGLDDRISSRFLRAGIGFGGSCFPKDVKALNYLSNEIGIPSTILPAALSVNELQAIRAVDMLEKMIDLDGKTIGLLGLAFKPDTDDMREAPSIRIANKLISSGSRVVGYDPIAKYTAEKALPTITHCASAAEVINNADAVVLVTEWNEFRDLKPVDFENMRGRIIIDGRRILDWKRLSDAGYTVKVFGQ